MKVRSIIQIGVPCHHFFLSPDNSPSKMSQIDVSGLLYSNYKFCNLLLGWTEFEFKLCRAFWASQASLAHPIAPLIPWRFLHSACRSAAVYSRYRCASPWCWPATGRLGLSSASLSSTSAGKELGSREQWLEYHMAFAALCHLVTAPQRPPWRNWLSSHLPWWCLQGSSRATFQNSWWRPSQFALGQAISNRQSRMLGTSCLKLSFCWVTYGCLPPQSLLIRWQRRRWCAWLTILADHWFSISSNLSWWSVGPWWTDHCSKRFRGCLQPASCEFEALGRV